MADPIASGRNPAYWDRRYAKGLIYGVAPMALARQVVGFMRERRLRRILEVGCGSGRNTVFYAQKGLDVTALDSSPIALQWAREWVAQEALNVRFLQGDFLGMALPANSFDAVVAARFLHLFLSEDRLPVVERMEACVRPGGLLILSVFSRRDPRGDQGTRWEEPHSRVDDSGKILHFFDREELCNLLLPFPLTILTLEEAHAEEKRGETVRSHDEWVLAAEKGERGVSGSGG